MDIGKIRTDSAKIEGGIWVEDIPGMPGLRLRVRGLTSASYRAALQKAQRAVPRGERNQDGTLPPAVADRVMGQAMHEAGLLGWDGLEQDGQPVPYDADLARQLLTDPDFVAFHSAVAYAADKADGVKKDGEALVVGNLPRSSNGTLNGDPSPNAS